MPMKVMFDSGASSSFIKKSALKRTKHLPISYNQQRYLMADGYTTFEVHGYVKVFIEFNQIKTSIIVGVVNSLCTDCILGMDYINKYKINLNNKEKQLEIYTSNDKTIIPMKNKNYKIKVICQLINSTYIYPYQAKRIKIVTQICSGQISFSPAYHLIHKKGLITLHSSISIINHVAWISVYNPTGKLCYLKQNIIVGLASPLSSTTPVSTIFDLSTTDKLDQYQIQSLTSICEQNIMPLIQYETTDRKLRKHVKNISPLVSAVTTRVQRKAPFHQLSPKNSNLSSEETSSLDDQPLQEEGHEFNVLTMAAAQKTDKLYQEKVLELRKNITNCSYILDDGILYKLFKRGVFTQKLIYVPRSVLNQLLNAYHNTRSAAHFGYYRTYYQLKDKYWWPDMKTTIKNYIQSCLKCQKFNIDRRQYVTTPFSPYQFQFGRQRNLSLDKPTTTYPFSKPNDYFPDFTRILSNCHQKAKTHMNQSQNYNRTFDRNRIDMYYNVGNQQLKRISHSPSKSSAIYSNSMIIIKQQHPTQ
ncbi:unnamed protein product [Rotaria sordida]|uniref:Integrase zinc-binding domain-containing protein n=1 Tax=Rotaria sordida TaxID=392033 RepID=A0A819G502_9BILA|nr:unnamed protein product [Rotaria sordida]